MPSKRQNGERRSALDKAAELAPSLARRPEAAKRDRREDDAGKTWDERHKAHAFRIRESDAERLAEHARALGLSKDALGAALIEAALDALDAGALAFEVEERQTEMMDKLDRLRVFVKRRARPLWQNGTLPEGRA